MVHVQFNLLTLKKQRRFKNMGFKRKFNSGIDTETYQGYAKLICADNGSYKYPIESFDDAIQFLTQNYFRGKNNFFWNIRFDFEALIKYLDYGELIELYHEQTLQYNKFFSISYLPSKYFSITDNHNNYYYFYDMHNFLEMSLNTASEKFLKDKKMTDIVDSKQLNINWQYWQDNLDNIILYCKKDALLTRQLADYFWDIIYEKINFNPKSPLSKGKLSEEYFLHKCDVPNINNISYDCLKTAYNAFYGGHFEILKRGYFDKVFVYDISSAYPAEIANLIDYSQGTWEKIKGKINENAHTGFYHCEVEAMEPMFSPFKVKVGSAKSGGLNIYPNGRFKQDLTKKEIGFIEAHFPNAAIKIDYGWEFTPKTLKYPFKEEIERLYEWKSKEQNPDIKYCVKIILNSLYGKFIQVSGKENITGKLFNPCYAAMITAGTRLKILELALQSPDNVISFSTDSVISTKQFHNIPEKPKMGEFGLEFSGEMVILMSDVYNIWNKRENKIRAALRGFALSASKETEEGGEKIKKIEQTKEYLKDILAKMNGDKYTYYTERPYHLGECLTHVKTRKITDLNIFAQVEKSIDINGDNKRVWEKKFKRGKDCLTESHESLPLMIKE